MSQSKRESYIKSIHIEGLFGATDVLIPFDNPCTILVGENGLGKTQILSILYYFLQRDSKALKQFDFKTVTITFSNDATTTATKNGKGLVSFTANVLQTSTQKELLFLPTYRRVEVNAQMAGLTTNNGLGGLLQFDMADVEELLDTRLKEINTELEGFLDKAGKDMTKNLLSPPAIDMKFFNDIKLEEVEIMLKRAKDFLTEDAEKRIFKIVKQKRYTPGDESRAAFLKILMAVYDSQREKDAAFRHFIKTCNGYLFNKQIVYDEHNVQVYIINNADKELTFSQLSSGEKQIVSIFSKLYLSDLKKEFIVIFDEPELSISIFWQKLLLPDIMKSKKVVTLLAATHSPFIFENDLDTSAIALSACINEAVTA